jgi:hypothetical protein
MAGGRRGLRLAADPERGGGLAFRVEEPGSTAIWSRPVGGASLTKQVGTGDPAPGLPGRALSFVEAFHVDDAGRVAFAGLASGGGILSTAPSLWVPGESAGHVPAVLSGTPAPGLPGVTFAGTFAGAATLTDSGGVVTSTRLAGADITAFDDTALWVPDGSGGLLLLAQKGDPAYPGFQGHGLSTGTGHVLFGGDALWRTAPGGSPKALATLGEPAGTQSGAAFAGFSGGSLEDDGTVAFAAQTTANEYGVWIAPPGETRELAFVAEGLLPGGPPGVVMTRVDGVNLTAAGEMVLAVALAGDGVTASNDAALLVPDDGGLRILAREGDPIPGGSGATLDRFQEILVNDAGDVVALAWLDGPSGLGRAILVAAAGGELELVVQEGAPFEVAAGDVRTAIAFGDFDFHSFATRLHPLMLSDARRFAFEAYFVDEGGAFSNGVFLVTLPEPATGLLVAAGLLGLGAARPARARAPSGSSRRAPAR